MRIETNPWNALTALNDGDRDRMRASSQDQSSSALSQDSEISDEAQLASRLVRQFAQIPDVREGRVAELRTAVQSGTYKVDPEQIADALLRDALPGRERQPR